VKQNIIYGNRAVCKIRGENLIAEQRKKQIATGVEPSTSTSGTGGNSFTQHAMLCVDCQVLVRGKRFPEPLVLVVTFIGLSSQFQMSVAIKKK